MTSSYPYQRRFPRLELSNGPAAVDANGLELGRVSVVGGGGMKIELSPQAAARQFPLGTRLTINVVEAGSETHTVDVEVRNREGGALGLEFVGAE